MLLENRRRGFRHGQVDDLQVAAQGIADRIPGSAFKMRHPAEAKRRSVDYIAVPQMHTAAVVRFRKNPHFVGLFPDGFPERTVLFSPAVRLIGAGECQKKPYIAVKRPETDYLKGGKRVEPAGPAADEGPVTAVVGLL